MQSLDCCLGCDHSWVQRRALARRDRQGGDADFEKPFGTVVPEAFTFESRDLRYHSEKMCTAIEIRHGFLLF